MSGDYKASITANILTNFGANVVISGDIRDVTSTKHFLLAIKSFGDGNGSIIIKTDTDITHNLKKAEVEFET